MRGFAVLAFISMLGCSDSTPSGDGCGNNSECSPGEVCIDGECRSICSSDADCGPANCETGRICQNGVCVTGCRAGAPAIDTIDGDGTVDTGGVHPDGTRTAHHIQDEIVVSGTNLEGADATLTTAADTIDLVETSSTDTVLIAQVPVTLAAGRYTLRVSNGAGSDQVDVWVLQGEQGPQGEPGEPPSSAEIQGAISSLSTLGCTGCIDTPDLNDGIITEEKMASSMARVGGNYLPNPYFARVTGSAPDAWSVAANGAAGHSVADVSSDGFAGPYALENDDLTRVVLASEERIPVDRGARYLAVGSFRRSVAAGSVGDVIFGVRLFDASGTEILDASEWWYVIGAGNPGDSWVRWEGFFGAGSAKPFPSEARFMDVGVRMNDDAGAVGNQVFQVQGLGLFGVAKRCPPDMVDAGAYCIDRDQNAAANWPAQAQLCQQEGKQLCSTSQWQAACHARSTLGLNDMLSGTTEYIDAWVFNYPNAYYSAYISAGGDDCNRLSYSGWACANSTCYNTTHPGSAYPSRCCKPN